MDIKINVSTKVEKKVKIEFPLYKKHDVSGDGYDAVYYYKVLPELTLVIHKTHYYHDDKIEWNLYTEGTGFGSSDTEDYLLGKGEYSLSEKEFADIWKEFLGFSGWCAVKFDIK